MAKKFLYIIPLIFLVLAASLYFYMVTQNNTTEETQQEEAQPTPSGPVVIINNTTIPVDLANTPDTRNLGLSVKDSLPEDRGMLFDFGMENTSPIFWMKDMKFDIDIIWINDGKVAQITSDVPAPPPGTTDQELTTYRSNTPIDYVLEVNAGFARENGISVGDEVEFSF